MKKMNRVLAILLAFLLIFGNMVDTVVYAVDLTSEAQPTETVAEPTPDVGGGA